MRIVIHRGTHQIGGIAAEIGTDSARIVIDMGDELSLDPEFVSTPLDIDGVTNGAGSCDAVLLTHYHGDHVGQIGRVRAEIPIYCGKLAKEIMVMSAEHNPRTDEALTARMREMRTFEAGKTLAFGDICVTPYCIDHSASDAYMFLVEADGVRVLYTGDFRLHGVRGKAMPKILSKLVRKVDAVVTEGTTVSRPSSSVPTERDLQDKLKGYLKDYKYVFALCATTNLDRVFAFCRAVPRGKYCVCDRYQWDLIKTVSDYWSGISSFYEMPKVNYYTKTILPRFKDRGGLMFVRNNSKFREIIGQLDTDQSIMLYCMWDGYRTNPGSKIPEFLDLAGAWEPLHTSGHASTQDIVKVVDLVDPEYVIPMHTDAPDDMVALFPERKVLLLADGEELDLSNTTS